MGRVFTTSFQHEGKTYTAVVSLSVTRDTGLSISIQIPDESLPHLLPGGRLTLMGDNGLQNLLDGKPALSQKLVQCILQAVDQHIDPRHSDLAGHRDERPQEQKGQRL